MDYDDMLERGISETPDIETSSGRFEVPAAEVRQEGHDTVFENFNSICDDFGRDPDHVLKFLQDELGTNAHIDESSRARLTGEFSANRIEDGLQAYADRYILCGECGLPDTSIEHEQGAEVLQCAACGAKSPT